MHQVCYFFSISKWLCELFTPDRLYKSDDLLFAVWSVSFPIFSVFLFRCFFHSPSFLEAIWLLRRAVEYPSESGKAFRPCASASLTGPRARRCRLYFPLIGLEIIVFHRWMAKPQQSGEGDSLVSQALMGPYATATAAWLGAVDLQPSSVRKTKSRKQLTNTWGDPSLPSTFSGSPQSMCICSVPVQLISRSMTRWQN